ncbi:L-serine ammonia-lyase, iron-sulfur-dependent, subunit alpha [Sedimentibacter sp. zth1]|uniref:L-serine ammonia-lyase, iron-sulfur-dependent, subunit alpha n=1 Tax=Sedimentibacter sp. zth1 TaxID=2816908 RepID=UPI001A91AB25|nr:L-serine ammonia-lyase, iron-sulfur-dependent, subunit alpha [Sedimentibacter sp. zth1]QSX05145.1 L-serine ammonia-lyase, iron-sulfur-dependent, subunit alpha [Sedimentibacter sp. zth1]
MYNNAKELLDECTKKNLPISAVVLNDEIDCTGESKESILKNMKNVLDVMKKSISDFEEQKTMGGIIGGEAKKLDAYLNSKKTICGESINKAMVRALAGAEHNASMGRICAAPTAGSSGIIPATIITGAEQIGCDDDMMIKGLLVASGIGKIIIQNATVSGAEGGCQAECGSAAAMAAAALVEMAGGTPQMCFVAASIALKNVMGLICDPIAGLVESPCSKRNSSGAVNAMTSAELALSGIKSVVDFDETVEAMSSVGRLMNTNLKETAMGGIAATSTGRNIAKKIHGIN